MASLDTPSTKSPIESSTYTRGVPSPATSAPWLPLPPASPSPTLPPSSAAQTLDRGGTRGMEESGLLDGHRRLAGTRTEQGSCWRAGKGRGAAQGDGGAPPRSGERRTSMAVLGGLRQRRPVDFRGRARGLPDLTRPTGAWRKAGVLVGGMDAANRRGGGCGLRAAAGTSICEEWRAAAGLELRGMPAETELRGTGRLAGGAGPAHQGGAGSPRRRETRPREGGAVSPRQSKEVQ